MGYCLLSSLLLWFVLSTPPVVLPRVFKNSDWGCPPHRLEASQELSGSPQTAPERLLRHSGSYALSKASKSIILNPLDLPGSSSRCSQSSILTFQRYLKLGTIFNHFWYPNGSHVLDKWLSWRLPLVKNGPGEAQVGMKMSPIIIPSRHEGSNFLRSRLNSETCRWESG